MTEREGAARAAAPRDWRARPAVVNVILIAVGWALLALMSNAATPLPVLALATGLVLLGAGIASASVAAVCFLRRRLRQRRSQRGRALRLRQGAAKRLLGA